MSAQDEDPTPYYPPGPALLYVHADVALPFDDPAATRTITQVDRAVPGGVTGEAEAQRERRILRALLEHALWLLDQEGDGS